MIRPPVHPTGTDGCLIHSVIPDETRREKTKAGDLALFVSTFVTRLVHVEPSAMLLPSRVLTSPVQVVPRGQLG